MSEVFENNSVLSLLRNFYIRNSKAILIIFSIFLILVILYISNNQITKNNNVKAAKIYNEWNSLEIETQDDEERAKKLFNDLITLYKDTGYSKIVLLNEASKIAKDGDINKALEYFLILKETTDGYGGNQLFNKVARINAARILYSQENYDKALDMLEKYSKSSDAFIHELIGDILNKQSKFEIAKEQYTLAKTKYNDESSISIITMKISNLKI
jgi:predicted negative regulator of RcsB-dependent stress response